MPKKLDLKGKTVRSVKVNTHRYYYTICGLTINFTDGTSMHISPRRSSKIDIEMRGTNEFDYK